MQRVVVTGMGVISCLGDTLDGVSLGLQEGRSGVIFDPERKARGFRSGLRTALADFDAKVELDRQSRKFMPEPAVYGALAAKRAIAVSGLTPAMLARDDVGIIIGNDSTCGPMPEVLETLERYKSSHFIGSSMVIKLMNSTVSMNLGSLIKSRGINLTVSAACASGAHSLGLGFQLIRSGAQRLVLCGGTQEMNWLSMVTFDALNAFSVCEDDPAMASRPFDRRRDGLVPGGGGAVLILESLASARERSAPIYGEIAAYSFTSDGDHLTLPSGDGAERCIKAALDQAGCGANDIDYVNAHATSTTAGDLAEARAIHRVFGANGPLVSSTKSMTGHECWMAGASEVVYSLLMMRDAFVAPNRNFDGFDDETPRINVSPETVRTELRTVLSNSFGFGGTNACIVLRRCDG